MAGLLLPSLVLAATVSTASPSAAIVSDMSQFQKSWSTLAHVTERDTVFDYFRRLQTDRDELATAQTDALPAEYTRDRYVALLDTIATLDDRVARDLLAARAEPMGEIRGLSDVLIHSSADGTLEPVAVYVPTTYDAAHSAPLVVFLHGMDQSESELLSPWYIQQLAESTHAIVIAPYARGVYDYRGTGATDVYDAVDAAKRAFNVDTRRTYLAGYSMGGFSVFEVAPKRPQLWTAALDISGSLLHADAAAALTVFRTTPLYVVTGKADQTIPTEYPTATADYFARIGGEVSYYQAPNGTHHMATLIDVLDRAWSDMLAGTIRQQPPDIATGFIPSQPPVAEEKI